MSKYTDLLQEYVNKPYDELLQIASSALATVMPAFDAAADDGNGAKFVVPFMSTMMAVDGKFSELEYNFLNDLLGGGVNYESAKANVAAHYNADALEWVDNLIDSIGEKGKTILLMLVLCFAAVDETISREENAYIAKLMS